MQRLALLGIVLAMFSPARADEPAKPVAAPAVAPASSQPSTTPTYKRRQDIVYHRAYGTALTMDRFTPTDRAPNGASVVLVVSGGWFASHDSIAGPFIDLFAQPFLKRGYTVFAVVPASQPKFTIPEITSYLDKAVQFIRLHSAAQKLDPNRIGIIGASAGGHLSLLQATAPAGGSGKFSLDKPAEVSGNVQAAAVFFPPTDFLNWGEAGVNVLDAPLLKPFLAAFDYEDLNAKTGRFESVKEKDRVNEILKQTSPVYRVSKETAPTLIVHGDKDILVPLQQAELFINKLKETGVPAELVVKKGDGHGWMNIQPDVERFADWFDKYLAPKI